MVFSQPAKKADKTGIDLQNVCADGSVLLLKLKGGSLYGICKYAAGMMAPFPNAVVQKKDRLLRCGSAFV